MSPLQSELRATSMGGSSHVVFLWQLSATSGSDVERNVVFLTSSA